MSFVKVASTDQLSPGSCTVVEVGNRELALFNVGGEFYCLDNSCPHMDGPLGFGELDGEVVYCPWHAWGFNVKSGESPHMPGVCVRRFACKVEGEDVLVEV